MLSISLNSYCLNVKHVCLNKSHGSRKKGQFVNSKAHGVGHRGPREHPHPHSVSFWKHTGVQNVSYTTIVIMIIIMIMIMIVIIIQ